MWGLTNSLMTQGLSRLKYGYISGRFYNRSRVLTMIWSASMCAWVFTPSQVFSACSGCRRYSLKSMTSIISFLRPSIVRPISRISRMSSKCWWRSRSDSSSDTSSSPQRESIHRRTARWTLWSRGFQGPRRSTTFSTSLLSSRIAWPGRMF